MNSTVYIPKGKEVNITPPHSGSNVVKDPQRVEVVINTNNSIVKTEATIFDLYRMCKDSYREEYGCTGCLNFGNCPLGNALDELTLDADKANDTILKWRAEHPFKTRQSEFLKQFPNASLVFDHLDICPKLIDEKAFECEYNCDDHCSSCKRDYWLAEV